jgi:hypothetical protein
MNSDNSTRPNLDAVSVLIGCGAGILATLMYATCKPHHFDRLLRKPRKVAGDAGDFVDSVSDDARDATTQMAEAAHRGVSKVDKASKKAIETVRSTLTD